MSPETRAELEQISQLAQNHVGIGNGTDNHNLTAFSAVVKSRLDAVLVEHAGRQVDSTIVDVMSLIMGVLRGVEFGSVQIHIASLQDKVEWMAAIHGAVVMAMELDSQAVTPLLRAFDLVRDFEVGGD